jgi:hypothetical protein
MVEVEESTPVLKMPEKVPLHEIDCMVTGCNLGPSDQIWKAPRLPGTVMTTVRAMHLHIHVEHGLNGALEERFLGDNSLIMIQSLGRAISRTWGRPCLRQTRTPG